MKITAVILAAGQGTRMRSSLPKVLHHIAGRPLIDYSLRLAAEIGSAQPVVVVGHGAEQVREAVGSRARCVVQQPQLGTAHAVQTAEQLLIGQTDLVLVISADMPLFTPATLNRLVQAQLENRGPISMLTMIQADSHGFGRILRAEDGTVQAIVEEAQATPEQLAIQELNVGAYCFRSDWLWDALRRVPLSPKGEYYITDLVGLSVADGQPVRALVVADASEAIGINTRVHLAEAEQILRRRINQTWLQAGVTLIDPETTYISPDVRIGADTILQPGTHLRGSTIIGERCVIGPNSIIADSQVGDDSLVLASVLDQVSVEKNSKIGPFAHLKKGT